MVLGRSALASASVLGSAFGQDLTDRCLGAIMGGALLDAAAMPLHWIYDTDKIDSLVQHGEPAFFSPPSCPFYTYSEGESTPYGQQNQALLKFLADSPPRPHFNGSAWQDAYYAYYGPKDATCHERNDMTHHKGCYWDGSTKGFVKNYEAGKRFPHVGADDTQANALVHMVPVTAAYMAERGRLSEVAAVIRVTQDTDDGEAFGLAGARVLRRVLFGKSLRNAVEAATAELEDASREHPKDEDAALAVGLRKVLEELEKPNFDVVKEVGQSCDYPFGLWSGSHLLAQLSDLAKAQPTAAFENATRQTILAGGDSGSRGYFVGAVMGAAVGESALPKEWKTKFLHYDAMLAQAKQALQNSFAV